METTVISAKPQAEATRTAYDRTFYSGIAIAMAVTVLAGFGPSYYFRAVVGSATFSGLTTLSPLLHVHGLLFSAWVALFILQTQLVARRKVNVHRQLGIVGALLAAAMIVVGVSTAIEAAQRGAAPPGVEPLVFLVVPLFDMVLFAGFVGAAVAKRRDRDAHKRLMLVGYAAIMPAAVARLPGMMPLGPLGFFTGAFLFAVAGAVYDKWSRGRIHPAYLWGCGILFLSIPVRLALAATPAWQAFAAFLTR